MNQSLKYILFHILLILGLATHSYCQHTTSTSPQSQVTLGLNVNPFLMAVYKAVEIGPTITYTYTLNKRLEVGASLFSRQQFISPRNEMGKANHINSTINLETNITPHAGIVFGKKAIKNKFMVFAGIRHDYYKEKLINSKYAINESYQYNELNLIYGLGYQLQYLFENKNGLSLRVLVPTNRNPLDDANRYSLELGYSIALK